MCRIILLSILILCISVHHTFQYEIAETEIGEADFDVLTFSQFWPVTLCKWWLKEMNGTDCHLPTEKNKWTIHGIWPTKYGHNYTYCNTSLPFDLDVLAPIEDELNQTWIYILGDDNASAGFWEHEWLKHGTCALDLVPFNSQFKYFMKAIEWNLKYSLSDMFAAAKLFPRNGKKFSAKRFTDAVKAKTKKSPLIHCIPLDDKQYVQEIRICFDKKLNVIDCMEWGVCSPSKPVYFPATPR